MAISDLSELSTIIGELRSFASQQTSTNAHMLEELKKISERMGGFGEVSAGLIESRKTLHERFARIHDQMGSIDERCDKIELKVDTLEDTVAIWRGQIKTLVYVFGIGGTIVSALASTYGSILIKALASHTP